MSILNMGQLLGWGPGARVIAVRAILGRVAATVGSQRWEVFPPVTLSTPAHPSTAPTEFIVVRTPEERETEK